MRHDFDMGNYRPRAGEDPEQSHVVGQQAQLALIIAEFHVSPLLGHGKVIKCLGTFQNVLGRT